MLYLRTLGELRRTGPSGDILSGRRKELALLAYLARHSPDPVPRAELATLLWGERPEKRARHSLRQALLKLKRAVGEGLEVSRTEVALAPGVVELDVAALEEDLGAGRLQEAVERWGGEFMATAEETGGEAYRLWVTLEREPLRRKLAWALERLVVDAENRADWAEAARWARCWVDILPYDEGATSGL